MTKPHDDLEAVRTLVETLQSFEPADQERVIRWAREKLGLEPASTAQPIPPGARQDTSAPDAGREQPPVSARDIKTFIAQKNPTSDNQFAATVAYYFRFEAPQADRKESITADDLQEACRQAGRSRLRRPAQTLVNAHNAGLLDKAGERGAYAINTVGENLVAMTLPSSEGPARLLKKPTRSRPKSKVTRRSSSKRR